MGLSEDLIQCVLRQLGEDPDREGLRNTPSRVVRSWSELYGGYKIDVSTIFTTFVDVHGYSQIVICKDIELYSICEHHMLPFFGKAHVSYLPDKKVIGLSKLARLVDIYARRLQIQERIGEQVTDALMQHLKPKAASCIIEATHLCMCMRGCSKQDSTTITSSMKGEFLKDAAMRAELLQLLKL